MVPPIVMLTAYWLIGTTLSARGSVNLLNAGTAHDAVVAPGRDVITALQEERRLSAVLLGGSGDAAALREQRTRTDVAVAAFRRLATAPDTVDALSDRAAQRVSEAVAGLQRLGSARLSVDRRDRGTQVYGDLVDSLHTAFQPLSELDDPESTRLFRSASNIGQVRELLAREDATLAGGRLAPAEQALFAQAAGARRAMLAGVVADLADSHRAAYTQLVSGPELAALRAVEDRLIETSAVPAEQWAAAHRGADERLRTYQQALDDAFAERSASVATVYYWRLGLTGAVGLAAIIFTIVVTVRVGSSLIRRLRSLRAVAVDLAHSRLPDVVDRLRHGEPVDVAAEAPPLSYGTDEIGQVGDAFSLVQRTAVESAIQEATVRHGLNDVFLNIARRSQTLIHRQLAVLDRMERRATDPDELEDLFRVDHLATRMRRHAEDLVIMAGATPGRGWRQPVPLVDVVRGAVSEVEDYARVQVVAAPEASLAGRAVTDLIHLLAELIENATSYSPPHTHVQVAGQLVPNGFAVEIEDRGLGMSAEQLEAANARLRRPPDFDPANSAHLGLFVVALLAARLGAQVTLRPSPYGGVTAIVLVPPDLIVDAPALPVAAHRAAEPLALGAEPEPVPVPALDDGDLTPDGLPRRPRNRPAPSTVDGPAPVTRRSPEEIREMMSAFQAGTARGRREAVDRGGEEEG